jgi:cell division protein FtsB
MRPRILTVDDLYDLIIELQAKDKELEAKIAELQAQIDALKTGA